MKRRAFLGTIAGAAVAPKASAITEPVFESMSANYCFLETIPPDDDARRMWAYSNRFRALHHPPLSSARNASRNDATGS